MCIRDRSNTNTARSVPPIQRVYEGQLPLDGRNRSAIINTPHPSSSVANMIPASSNGTSVNSFLQGYDNNEPWRNFEIDLNNGLGNSNFVPLEGIVPNSLTDCNVYNPNQEVIQNGLNRPISNVNEYHSTRPHLTQYSLLSSSSAVGSHQQNRNVKTCSTEGSQSLNESSTLDRKERTARNT